MMALPPRSTSTVQWSEPVSHGGMPYGWNRSVFEPSETWSDMVVFWRNGVVIYRLSLHQHNES